MPISLTDHLAAVTRSVSSAARGSRPARLLTLSRRLGVPVEETWTALTTAERIGRWWAPIEGELEVGAHFSIEGVAEGDVVACTSPDNLTLTWLYDGHTSDVSVSLRPLEEGATLLQVDHILPTDEAHDAEYADLGPGADGAGWEFALVRLAEHLDAWTAARDEAAAGGADPVVLDPGVTTVLLEESITAWSQAAVDAGEDADRAAAAARRCLAAYRSPD